MIEDPRPRRAGVAKVGGDGEPEVFVADEQADVQLDLERWRTLALAVLASTVSCTAWGLALGSLGMRFRDVFLIANVAYYVMWILCGVNLPESAVPGPVAWIGRLLPMSHGITAARRLVHGGTLASAAAPLAVEGAIAAAYLVLALLLFRLFEAEGKRRATLEQA